MRFKGSGHEMHIVLAPLWHILQPPFGIASLKAYLEHYGVKVQCHDLNIEFYHQHKSQHGEMFMERNISWFQKQQLFNKHIKPLLEPFFDRWISQFDELPAMMGFSTYYCNKLATLLLAGKIKRLSPNTVTVLGGPSTMSDADLVLNQHVDIEVIREGEQTLLELAQGSIPKHEIKGLVFIEDGKQVFTGERPLIKDINTLPIPDFSDFDVLKYTLDMRRKSIVLPITSSRGCVGKCRFCFETEYWKHFRPKKPESILESMDQYNRVYATNNFVFSDSIFTGHLGYIEKLCDLLLEGRRDYSWGGQARFSDRMGAALLKKMAAAGCTHMELGLETGSQRLLDDMNKKIKIQVVEQNLRDLKRAGIRVGVFLMNGYPTETEEDFQATLDFLDKNHDYIDTIFLSAGFNFNPHSWAYDNMDKFDVKYDSKGKWYNSLVNSRIIEKRNRAVEQKMQELKLKSKEIFNSSSFNKISSTQRGNIVNIPPDSWNASEFDVWKASYWAPKEGFSEGFEHMVARNKGQITYKFGFSPVKFKKISISARVASHSKLPERILENSSSITLLVNSVEAGTKQVYYEWPFCSVKEWIIEDPELIRRMNICEGENSVTFRVEDSEFSNGITIYYRAIDPKLKRHEMPIVIEFIE